MSSSRPGTIPSRAGVGLKPQHYRDILQSCPDIGFFEVHAENYMGAGGPPHLYLTAIRDRYPLSIHGVGLSIGSDRALDKLHMERLKQLIARYQPALFSEHLAWSSHDAGFLNDLLPLPYTGASLRRVVDHIDEVQEALGRTILLENPSTYLAFAESTYSEAEFISTIAHRTGCQLLLDVNNIYVSSVNQGIAPDAYLNALCLSSVREIHLAGHLSDPGGAEPALLIDTHDRCVAAPVWALCEDVLRKTGPVPVLIEWDNNIPAFSVLKSEADGADRLIAMTETGTRHVRRVH